ncbi:7303_t:CDS:2 [Entrophospora sp. SA101]|nr:7303_t:CDS:2 [Entrophospora sp. SA101]
MFVFSLTKSFKRLPTGGSCISNTPSNGYVARYTTQKSFFNRKQKLVKFKNAFSAPDPKLHVVLGSSSSGKTALIRKTIYNSISSQLQTFFKKHMKFLTKMLQQVEISAVTDDLQLKFKPFGEGQFNEKEVTSNDVIELLDNIDNALPKWTCRKGYNIPPPILIIAEVNMFSQLVISKKGKSSSQFNSKLACGEHETGEPLPCFLHIPHATPYVVGDLSKEDAEEYFEMSVLHKYECKELRGKFDRICRITGTRMLIIDMYVPEYKIYKGKLEDYDFSVYESEYGKLIHDLYPESLKSPVKPHPPLWEKSHLITTMEAIVKAEDFRK